MLLGPLHAQFLPSPSAFDRRLLHPVGKFVRFFIEIANGWPAMATLECAAPPAGELRRQPVVTLLLRDRDVIYGKGFDKTTRDAGIPVKKNSVRAPNLQAHVERFVQSIQKEVLDHFIVFDEEHVVHLVSQYLEHYHKRRGTCR